MEKTAFLKHIEKDDEKKKIYEQAVKENLIQEFDPEVQRNLKKSFFGFYSGFLYVYYYPTDFHTLANKLHLLCHVLEDRDFELVHGHTDSTREIKFYQYGVQHLDYNSWIEVKEGRKTWVYDLFSLLKIEKGIYTELEHPKAVERFSKDAIMNHPGKADDDFSFHEGDAYLLTGFIPKAEKELEQDKHPYRNILDSEITRLKEELNYDKIVLDWKKEQESIQKRSHK